MIRHASYTMFFPSTAYNLILDIMKLICAAKQTLIHSHCHAIIKENSLCAPSAVRLEMRT